MDRQYFIVFSIKTMNGPESFGKFLIGNNRQQAVALFETLSGDRAGDGSHRLLVEMMECAGDLPLNMDIIGCTLEQFGENCKIIAREAFKMTTIPKQ